MGLAKTLLMLTLLSQLTGLLRGQRGVYSAVGAECESECRARAPGSPFSCRLKHSEFINGQFQQWDLCSPPVARSSHRFGVSVLNKKCIDECQRSAGRHKPFFECLVQNGGYEQCSPNVFDDSQEKKDDKEKDNKKDDKLGSGENRTRPDDLGVPIHGVEDSIKPLGELVFDPNKHTSTWLRKLGKARGCSKDAINKQQCNLDEAEFGVCESGFVVRHNRTGLYLNVDEAQLNNKRLLPLRLAKKPSHFVYDFHSNLLLLKNNPAWAVGAGYPEHFERMNSVFLVSNVHLASNPNVKWRMRLDMLRKPAFSTKKDGESHSNDLGMIVDKQAHKILTRQGLRKAMFGLMPDMSGKRVLFGAITDDSQFMACSKEDEKNCACMTRAAYPKLKDMAVSPENRDSSKQSMRWDGRCGLLNPSSNLKPGRCMMLTKLTLDDPNARTCCSDPTGNGLCVYSTKECLQKYKVDEETKREIEKGKSVSLFPKIPELDGKI